MSKKSNETRRSFLLGFFETEVGNETLELNGHILFKHWDGNKERWTVDIFTPESWKNMKERRKIQAETLF